MAGNRCATAVTHPGLAVGRAWLPVGRAGRSHAPLSGPEFLEWLLTTADDFCTTPQHAEDDVRADLRVSPTTAGRAALWQERCRGGNTQACAVPVAYGGTKEIWVARISPCCTGTTSALAGGAYRRDAGAVSGAGADFVLGLQVYGANALQDVGWSECHGKWRSPAATQRRGRSGSEDDGE